MASTMLVDGCVSNWRGDMKATGEGDCFNFWLPVTPVTTTSDSFTFVSVMGLCWIESGTTCPVADEDMLTSNIVLNIVFIVVFLKLLFFLKMAHIQTLKKQSQMLLKCVRLFEKQCKKEGRECFSHHSLSVGAEHNSYCERQGEAR